MLWPVTYLPRQSASRRSVGISRGYSNTSSTSLLYLQFLLFQGFLILAQYHLFLILLSIFPNKTTNFVAIKDKINYQNNNHPNSRYFNSQKNPRNICYCMKWKHSRCKKPIATVNASTKIYKIFKWPLNQIPRIIYSHPNCLMSHCCQRTNCNTNQAPRLYSYNWNHYINNTRHYIISLSFL